MSAPLTQHTPQAPAPLAGIRVLEFSHMIMGPSCGMILADLGADVVKVEPGPAGDNSRRLTGAAIGFFPTLQPQQAQHLRRYEESRWGGTRR